MKNLIYEKLERVDTPEGRYYVDTDGVRYASVTTILKKTTTPNVYLEEWLKNATPLELQRAANRAAYGSTRGNKLHGMVEDFLLRGVEGRGDYYESIRPFLSRVSEVRALELMVKHPKAKYAGTLDAWALVDGRPALIDWKTAFKKRKKDWMRDYHIQCAAYAGVIRHVYGEQIQDAYIVVAIGGRRRMVFPGKRRAQPRRERQRRWFAKLRSQFCCKTVKAQIVHMDLASLEKHWKLWLRRIDRFNGHKMPRRKSLQPKPEMV